MDERVTYGKLKVNGHEQPMKCTADGRIAVFGMNHLQACGVAEPANGLL